MPPLLPRCQFPDRVCMVISGPMTEKEEFVAWLESQAPSAATLAVEAGRCVPEPTVNGFAASPLTACARLPTEALAALPCRACNAAPAQGHSVFGCTVGETRHAACFAELVRATGKLEAAGSPLSPAEREELRCALAENIVRHVPGMFTPSDARVPTSNPLTGDTAVTMGNQWTAQLAWWTSSTSTTSEPWELVASKYTAEFAAACGVRELLWWMRRYPRAHWPKLREAVIRGAVRAGQTRIIKYLLDVDISRGLAVGAHRWHVVSNYIWATCDTAEGTPLASVVALAPYCAKYLAAVPGASDWGLFTVIAQMLAEDDDGPSPRAGVLYSAYLAREESDATALMRHALVFDAPELLGFWVEHHPDTPWSEIFVRACAMTAEECAEWAMARRPDGETVTVQALFEGAHRHALPQASRYSRGDTFRFMVRVAGMTMCECVQMAAHMRTPGYAFGLLLDHRTQLSMALFDELCCAAIETKNRDTKFMQDCMEPILRVLPRSTGDLVLRFNKLAAGKAWDEEKVATLSWIIMETRARWHGDM